jgi:hypothetical protein
MIRSSCLFLAAAILTFGFSGCGQPDNATTVDGLTFDPCKPLVVVPDASTTDAERQGIAGALAMWNSIAGSQLSTADVAPTDGTASVPLIFQAAGAPFHGLYDPKAVQIYLNSDLSGSTEQITLAHEIGHAFGMVHISGRPSVMNAGNLTVVPNTGDVTTLAGLWGSCNTPPASPSGS